MLFFEPHDRRCYREVRNHLDCRDTAEQLQKALQAAWKWTPPALSKLITTPHHVSAALRKAGSPDMDCRISIWLPCGSKVKNTIYLDTHNIYSQPAFSVENSQGTAALRLRSSFVGGIFAEYLRTDRRDSPSLPRMHFPN